MTFTSSDVEKLKAYCVATLDLGSISLGEEYGYGHLPLCVVDTVFSIGVRYTSTKNTVLRFCNYFGLETTNNGQPFPPEKQFSIAKLLAAYTEHGLETLVNEVYQNRQRTSTRGGILKAEAVQRFCQVLISFGVNYLQEVDAIFEKPAFETKIKAIQGQSSGVSLQYFYMLVGSDDYVKADRMVHRFVDSALGRSFTIDETRHLIVQVAQELKADYPPINPRNLDHKIWLYQSGRN